ncbi:hypothetical protein POM88_006892 [Heracleum sosnowskyi]|uniref:Uncharacterized protein n=1 Tax=Heracleum sosnowskyi TaxID=360622 RepID=A0AAD8J3K7_9APIA|nr:hypothetical protein POM88_006892 [Heracleum sosnowskyi]
MHNHVLNCKDAKHIWETIEIINEGTEEVRENRMAILISEYEHFKSNPGEGISEVFERYNKLINDLNLHGKYYTIREINKKFLLTLPTHLEHRISAIREARDLSEISLERLHVEYGVTFASQSDGDFYSMEELEQLEDESMALIARRNPKQAKKTSYTTNQKSKPGKAYLAEGKSWDDSESEDEEVDNLALMEI